MDIQIDNEAAGDQTQIHQVTKQAFLQAAHTSHTEHFIVDALRRAGALTISQVAKVNGEIIGHVALSPVTISSGVRGWYGLGPVSVLPDYQRRGVGSKLIKSSLGMLKAMGASGCAVLGEPAYYSRFGFIAVDGLTLPDVPAEYFLALTFDQTFPQGEVSYHHAFSAQD